MRVGLLAIIFATGCTERALEIPLVGDFAGADLTRVDLAGADLAGDMTAPPVNHCPAGTQFIYTIDSGGTLSRFNPVNAEFFDVGPISCPTDPSDTPNSMAIDRTGNGYVNFQSGNIYRLLTATGECSATSYVPGHFGIETVGMSFAEDTAGGPDETLFVTPTNSAQASLASIDVSTFKVKKPVDLPTTANGELTGDNEANLWGFFPSVTEPLIVRIDKKQGSFDRELHLGALAGNPTAWGFAAWQGDFYVFLMRDVDSSSAVYHVDGETGATDTVLFGTGREIVGVGVATCAGPSGD